MIEFLLGALLGWVSGYIFGGVIEEMNRRSGKYDDRDVYR